MNGDVAKLVRARAVLDSIDAESLDACQAESRLNYAEEHLDNILLNIDAHALAETLDY